jgi:hypothetical protein
LVYRPLQVILAENLHPLFVRMRFFKRRLRHLLKHPVQVCINMHPVFPGMVRPAQPTG